jgi:hypothetical protein
VSDGDAPSSLIEFAAAKIAPEAVDARRTARARLRSGNRTAKK